MKMKQKFLIPVLAASAIMLAVSCNEQDEPAEPTNTETTMEKKGDTTLPTSDADLAKLIQYGEGDFKYSVEDFFRNPEKTAFKISPEGDYFSYMAPYESRMNVFVQKIGEEEGKRITGETDRDISGYFWGNNNRILYIKDAGGDEDFKLFAVDRDGQNPKDLTPYDSVRIQLLDDLPEVDDEIIIEMNKRNRMLFEPYRLNIATGEVTLLAENTNPMNPIAGWVTDHEGRIRIALSVTDGINTTLLYRETEEDTFRKVLTTNFKETVSPIFFDFDNGPIVYATSNLGRDKAAIVKFDMEKGKEVAKLFEHPMVDVSGLSYSRKRKVPTIISYTVDKREVKFLDDHAEKIYNRLKQELPGYEVVLTSTNRAEDKFLVRTYSDRSLGSYYYYDLATDEVKKLTDVSPWIDEADMAPMKPIKYTTRDGLTIHGYLTLPQGKEAKNLPVVINPHGGPWHRDGWGFNPEVQLLASRGYAVLQMNFRGSTGYGRKFWEASFKQWGHTMQDDITDGVKWLIQQGIADPERVAIYGASYGGYATLAGVAFTPDLYACAVNYVGVSNLFTFLNTIPPYWKPFLDMMHEMVGNPTDQADSVRMHQGSPVFHVDNIKTPLFVVQGANDPRVNIDESDQIVRNLRERDVEVPYMVKYNEGHGFHNEENRFEFYKVMLGFLGMHLGTAPVAG